MMVLRNPLAAAALAIYCVGVSVADIMVAHSFEPPFTHLDPSGEKGVSKDWKTGGVATVNNNFLRLTPDRQSKKGSLWSRKSLGVETFSSVFTFRISGQGKKFFGDGMALWFIKQAYYVEGDFHGSVERFTGFGVVFDTFKNSETLAYHRDVSIVFNDGDKTTEFMLEKKEGCDANIRFHEDRGDFDVRKNSRAKVTVEAGKKVTVFVDDTNDGTFKECASLELPFEDPAWVKQAHIGVTASTGQLADNHDVLGLVTFSDLEKHEQHLQLTTNQPFFGRGQGVSAERFERLEDKVNELLTQLDFVQHQFEHELAAVEDQNKNTVAKLKDQESLSEARIEALERGIMNNVGLKIQNSVSEDVHGRITSMTNSMDEQISERIAQVEGILTNKIGSSMGDAMAGMSGSWKIPFFVLFAMMLGFGVGLYKWYQQLKKTHML